MCDRVLIPNEKILASSAKAVPAGEVNLYPRLDIQFRPTRAPRSILRARRVWRRIRETDFAACNWEVEKSERVLRWCVCRVLLVGTEPSDWLWSATYT